MERLRERVAVRRYSDLLPDVLIEAQGCDEITALAALRRSVETLSQSYGFCEADIFPVVTAESIKAGDDVRIGFPEESVLAVESVTTSMGQPLERWTLADGILTLSTKELPSGRDVALCVHYSIMPSVDGEFPNPARFTKWRNLIVARALEDLFAMPKQPWADTTRFQLYRERASKWLEDFLITEHHFHGDARSRSAAQVTPAYNVFC